MPLNIRIDGDVVILSSFGRLMNDPRYVDAGRDVRSLLDQGRRNFVLDLSGVHETGASLLGVLLTVTRQIRQYGGETALAHLSPDTRSFIEKMQLDDYWDIFKNVEEAREFFQRGPT